MCSQRLERIFKNRTRQVRAVAVESNGASVMVLREVCEDRNKACGETFTFLGNHAHLSACQLRQFVYIGVRAHNGDFDIAQ
jgi:hypothetical protein